MMLNWILLLVGIASSAAAQLVLKYGMTGTPQEIVNISALVSPHIVLSASLYGLSFVVYAYLLTLFQITFLAPLMVGGVLLIIFVAGSVLGENVNSYRVAGAILLLLGSILIVKS